MTEQTELTRGRKIVERWCVLAEQRLDHLTELFETGRWRRYFGEVEFLDNIQDAKRAVVTWRALLEREATSDNRPVDLAWLGKRTVPPRMISLVMQPANAPAHTIERRSGPPLAIVAQKPLQPIAAVQETADQQPWSEALDPAALQERYPLLRNAM